MFYQIRQASIALLLGATLTACTTVAPPSTPTNESWQTREAALSKLNSWKLSGKVAAQTSSDSGSATMDWRQQGSHYTVSLLGPLGAGGMTLTGQPGNVDLQMSDGKHYRATNPEELLARGWGFNLPVSYLHYWIRGLPVPGIPSQNQFDSYHRLTSLSQQGWQVQILAYTRAGTLELPSKLAISSPTLSSKIVVYEWKIG